MADKILPSGFWFEGPRPGAPAFVKGRVSIKVHDFIEFLETHVNDAGYVNLSIKTSMAGKLYTELDVWEPKKQPAATGESVAVPPDVNPDDIPF